MDTCQGARAAVFVPAHTAAHPAGAVQGKPAETGVGPFCWRYVLLDQQLTEAKCALVSCLHFTQPDNTTGPCPREHCKLYSSVHRLKGMLQVPTQMPTQVRGEGRGGGGGRTCP